MASAPTIAAAFSPTSIGTSQTSTLTLTITNTNASLALSGLAVAAQTLPANLTGSTPGTTCGGTASYSAGAGLSLSGGSLAAGTTTSCTVTLTVSSTTTGTYSYTTGAVSSSSPPTTGTTATTSTVLTVFTVPGAPTIGTATAGNAQASVTFTAPGSNGGSAITGYTVTSSPGNITASGSASPITVTGLTNGTAYTFTVTATNAAGSGPASAASNSVTPQGPQTITFANPGPRSFGTSPTLTASASSGLTVAFTSSTTGVCTITTGGTLTFVTAGSCSINADQAGNTAYTAAPTVTQTFAVNAVVPGAPTIGTATAGNAQASVTFTAPTSNGGAAVTGYTVTSSGGQTATGATSPIMVTGLANGTAYTFTVRATNTAGTGPTSAASNSVTPQGPQTITFANPGPQNFGTTPTLTASASSDLTVAFTSSTTGVCTITPSGTLTFVTTGSCSINADQAGNAAYSAAPTVTQSFAVNAVVPGAPTIGAATAGDAQASVTFTAPTSNGGAAVTGYTVTSSGGQTATGATSPIVVTGLANGTAYTFTVKATNSAGTGAASAASNSVTPQGPQTITFANPGAQNFGTTPTLTASASSNLPVAFTSATTGVCTITPGGTLTFVTTGSCSINADQAGNTAYTAAPTVTQTFAVNAVVPGAPTIGTATAGNAQASVAFTAPTSNGGAAVTGYTVTSSGGQTATGATSPIVVTGLANGTAYAFTVKATNTAGTGAASAASNSVTPQGTQTITFANPGAQNFGTTPTLTASASSGLTVAFTSSTTGVCTITPSGALTFVTTGSCSINADQAGNAAYTAAPTVTQTFAVNAVVPGAPTIGTATAGNAQASVTFTAPTSNGGATVTGYTVTSSGGQTATGATSPIVVTGLTNGTAYTFTVKATNTAGSGPASAASNSVTPTTVPGTPTIGTATAGNAQASVTFTAPASNGGSAITSYIVTSSGGQTATGTTSPITVTGLTNGTAYTFTVKATNSVGTGLASAPSNAVTPATVPGAPTIGTATAGNAQASVTFTAPTSNGGAAVTGYTVTSSPGGITATGATSPITVTGLTNDTAYTFTVKATNSAGTGPASAASNAVTPVALPTVASISPASGSAGGGASVTITGTNLTGASAVSFGGTAAMAFSVVNATTITATTPAHAAGAVNVVVTTPGGTGTKTGGYTYVTAVTLSATPSGTTQVGQDYAQANVASGGTTPYAYTVSAGALPAGTALNGSTGVVSGKPTTAGGFGYTIKVTDSSPAPQTATAPTSGTIGVAATTTQLASSFNPSQFGQSVTLTATVATPVGTPTGTVTFRDDATAIGTGSLSGGSATFTTASLAPGAHVLTARYEGDGNFGASSSPIVRDTVLLGCADAFANATAVAGATGTLVGSNVGAIGEQGEPDHAGNSIPLNSVWCKWTAPASGPVTFDTTGSGFDTTLAIYTGTSVGLLTAVGANDNLSSRVRQSRVTFTATQGVTYAVAIDGAGPATGNYIATWSQPVGTPNLFAAVLPSSRSIQTNTFGTAFAALINNGSATATGCSMALPPGFPATFLYQTTDATNQLIGSPNTPIDIGAGQIQNFVFGVTPTIDMNATEVAIIFGCTNAAPAISVFGVNTLSLTATTALTPDLITIAATLSGDGIVNVPANGDSSFAAAAINIGAAGTLTATVDDDGAGLPLQTMLCQSNPVTGLCVNPPVPGPITTTALATGESITYTIVLHANDAIAFDPAYKRLFLRISTPDGVVRGSTSVAVRTR